ncbi:rhodanese-like domain-containing protein [Nocardiopsis sp. YSL2]|uniref:rhodanese-like domain-containing protein n=1 Tax=Nocardiopsis sp. YSL2 TaxID=2939492 RepID=UPI0026F41163|nr:rhodanese-like domain-containing protein [Nocardiopsis sp. YSL2]
MSDKTIDVASVRALIASAPDTLLVDVRTPSEFEDARIDGAVNLPLGQADHRLKQVAEQAGDRRLVLVCRSDRRAHRCRADLEAAGIRGAVVMTGGMIAWAAAGAPVLHGTGARR